MILKVVLLFAAVFSTTKATSLIDKWGRCKITDPNLNECLSKACANMVVDLKTGNAEHGIPPWEPFIVSKMVLKSGGKGPVNMQLIMDELTLIHITDFSKLTVDASQLKDMIFKLTLDVPSMNITSKYKMSGQMLTVPVKGAGETSMFMTDTKIEMVMKGKPLDKGGKTYWNIFDFGVSFFPSRMRMAFTGLFNGDKKLGEATNKILNENWKLMNKEFQPYISSEFGKTAMPIANIITQLEPFDEMFPK